MQGEPCSQLIQSLGRPPGRIHGQVRCRSPWLIGWVSLESGFVKANLALGPPEPAWHGGDLEPESAGTGLGADMKEPAWSPGLWEQISELSPQGPAWFWDLWGWTLTRGPL
jgi:hypothetical protein